MFAPVPDHADEGLRLVRLGEDEDEDEADVVQVGALAVSADVPGAARASRASNAGGLRWCAAQGGAGRRRPAQPAAQTGGGHRRAGWRGRGKVAAYATGEPELRHRWSRRPGHCPRTNSPGGRRIGTPSTPSAGTLTCTPLTACARRASASRGASFRGALSRHRALPRGDRQHRRVDMRGPLRSSANAIRRVATLSTKNRAPLTRPPTNLPHTAGPSEA